MKAIKQFFTNRLNKDNFWNMMLPFGWSIGILLSSHLIDNPTLLGWTQIALIPSMIYLVKRKQGISFNTKKDKFIRANGNIINSPTASTLFLAIVTLICLSLVMPKLLASDIPVILKDFSFAMIIFGAIPMMFCMSNYPISIMFNKHMWQGNSEGSNRSSSSIHNSSIGHKAFCSSNSTTGLSYSSLSSNVHSSRY